MMQRTIFSVAAVGVIATAAIAASPVNSTGGPWTGPLANSPLGRTISGCIGRVLTLRSDLNVTDQQRQQIREVVISHRAEIATTVKSVRDKRVALRDLVRTGDADESQIRAAADALGQAVSDAAVKAVALRGEIAPLLTQEQHATIDGFFTANDTAINNFLEAAAGN